MDTTTVLNTVWNVALTVAAAMLPFVIPLLTQKAAALLKIKSDDALYASLYRTIDNVLKALIASKGIATVNPAAISGALVSEAVDLVKANNPKAVAQTGQSDQALTTKILAKIPEARSRSPPPPSSPPRRSKPSCRATRRRDEADAVSGVVDHASGGLDHRRDLRRDVDHLRQQDVRDPSATRTSPASA